VCLIGEHLVDIGGDLSASELVVTLEPSDDAGARTADQYEWQAAMAAADGLRMYLERLGPDGRLRVDHGCRVLCERHEDWVAMVGDDAELVSAKHYGSGSGPYTTMNALARDGGLAHLFGRWQTMREKAGCRLVTTLGLSGQAKRLVDISKHLRELRMAGLELSVDDEARKHLQSFGNALLRYWTALSERWRPTSPDLTAEQLAEVMRFLSMFTFQEGITRQVVRDAAPGRYMKPVLDKLASTAAPEAIWEAVLSLFRECMRAAGPTPTAGLPGVLTTGPSVTVPTPAERERDLRSRIVTLDDIHVAIRVAIRSLEAVPSDAAETTMAVPDFYEDVWTAEGLPIGRSVRPAEVAALLADPRPGLKPADAARRTTALNTLELALQAKSVFTALNGAALRSGTLHMIYHREVSRWPGGDRADSMLFEAAGAHLRARREIRRPALGPLTRLLTGIAAAASASPRVPAALDAFVVGQGEQVGDAHELFQRRQENVAWLLIDLGPETVGDHGRFAELTWWLHVPGETPEPTTVEVHGGGHGMRRAVRDLLARMPMESPLRVDIAAPADLLVGDIDRWLEREVDGELEPIGAECQVRKRWSQRLHEPFLRRRVISRVRDESWDDTPPVATAAELSAADSGASWLDKRKGRAFMVGGDPAGAESVALRATLRAGFCFLLWYDRYVTPDLRAATMRTIDEIPPRARREALPELEELATLGPAIIWDDPDGRAGYPMPQIVPAEHL
jgi:hypothetical protein